MRTARAEGFRAGGSGPRCGTVAVEQALGVRVGPGLGLGGARGRAFTNSLNGTGRCLSRVSVVRLPLHCPAKKIGRSSDSSSAARSPRGAHLPAYRRGRRSFRRARTPKLHIERWLLQNRCSPSLWPPQRAQRSAPTPSKSRACARCQPPPAASSCTQHRRKRFHSVPRASIARGCID